MRSFLTAFRFFLFFTVLTGIAYPILITGIARWIFPMKSGGSIVFRDNRPVGSQLIGQSFDSSAIYFTSRPSAVSYNPLPSGGSNYGLTNIKLKEQFDLRRKQFFRDNRVDSLKEIPSEMLFASASGLDPHISPGAAMLQVERVCKARNFTDSQKIRLVETIGQLTEPPQLLFLGQIRINVLLLNLETDKIR
jgi:potassium-transporting ATPase KdpC subunit